jgi:hypothetical protein
VSAIKVVYIAILTLLSLEFVLCVLSTKCTERTDYGNAVYIVMIIFQNLTWPELVRKLKLA